MRAIVHENLMRTNEKNTNICLLKNLNAILFLSGLQFCPQNEVDLDIATYTCDGSTDEDEF